MRHIAFLINYSLAIEKSRTQNQNKASKNNYQVSQLKCHYLIQSKKPTNKTLLSSQFFSFLYTINAVPQKYGSFEKAEQAIRDLVVELDKS